MRFAFQTSTFWKINFISFSNGFILKLDVDLCIGELSLLFCSYLPIEDAVEVNDRLIFLKLMFRSVSLIYKWSASLLCIIGETSLIKFETSSLDNVSDFYIKGSVCNISLLKSSLTKLESS